MINKKLAFVTPRMIIGGAESYIITKASWLINNGFDIIVISLGGENVINLTEGVEHFILEGIDDSPLLFNSKSYDIFIESLSNILTQNKVDIIEAHNTFPVFHVAMSYKNTGIPFLANILSELSYYKNPLLAILTRKLNQFGLYYALTTEMNTHIENTIRSKLDPVILPIPVKGIITLDEQVQDLYILSVCRLSEDKMYVKYLIEDFYTLYSTSEALKNYKLKIVGDGPFFNEIEDLVNKLNEQAQVIIIELLGTIVGDELEALYKNCFAFAGMGTSLLLAASCGKPSILAGFVKDTEPYSWGYWGENALDRNVIGVGSDKDRVSTSYANIISILIGSQDRSLKAGNAAKKMFEVNYDFDIIMNNWNKEYLKVIKNYKNNKKLKSKLNFSLEISSLRTIRYVYKAIFKNKK
ncbi:glycosyltransferase [Flavobacterium frigidarium]|uniref:glycosyltransferase n=1 Tax=Flavobacterium frigidarium TaxID=99286 RepID=UPI0030DCDCDE|tara:strand:- start:3358 stop:4590 length:1233 start_codon:yes stop_codon:yes gene_type:complete